MYQRLRANSCENKSHITLKVKQKQNICVHLERHTMTTYAKFMYLFTAFIVLSFVVYFYLVYMGFLNKKINKKSKKKIL